MNPSMISLRPKWPLILMVVAFGAFATVAVSRLRVPVLRAAGWALVANDPVTSADIIIISADSGPAGALQAADRPGADSEEKREPVSNIENCSGG
jgi:hypothetical protein